MNDKLEYLLNHMDYYIEQTIYDVLNDSEADPQYSAVTVNNLIVCYLDVTHQLGWNNNIFSVEEYLRDKCFLDDEIILFTNRKNKESEYYIGTQY